MQKAVIAGAIVGAVCGAVGVYVVLKGLSFIGAGIAHASFGGVAIGVALGINPVWSAVVFCIGVAWAIAGVTKNGRVKQDIAVGVFFASTMALGILIIGLFKHYEVDLFGYLFGSITAVGAADLWTIAGAAIGIMACIAFFYKDLLFITFDYESARVSGLPASRLYYLLMTLIAVAIVISIKTVGIILVSALIVTPAASAYQLVESFRAMMMLSIALGVLATVAGLFIADAINIEPGACIVLLTTLIFFASYVVSPRRRRSIRATS